jgi:hypothetical protein
LAVVVALGGFASLAALTVTTAQASTAHATTTTPADKLCSPGTTNTTYCAYYCPSGTLVGQYCEDIATPAITTNTVLPQGPPTEFDAVFWGAKFKLSFLGELIHGRIVTGPTVTKKGPALKFHVKAGINGAPNLRSLTLTLPAGLTFTKQFLTLAVDGPIRTLTSHTMKLTFRGAGVTSFLVYLKKHSMLESSKLRNELASGKLKTVPFGLSVTDVAGTTTRLSFSVPPSS